LYSHNALANVVHFIMKLRVEDDGNMVETVNQQKLYQQDFVACVTILSLS